MPHFGSLRWLSAIVILLVAQQLSASTQLTYVVGTCQRPTLPNFPTISAALAATPPAAVVEICPGTYNEQVVISSGVTLKGLASGDLGGVVIAAPIAGLVANATDTLGDSFAAQILVSNVAGNVTLQNLTVDNTTAPGCSAFETVGIYFQNSSGTIDEVATSSQNTCDRSGIRLEGGTASPTPSVTVEKSSVHDFSFIGIYAETTVAGDKPLTAIIEQNNVNAPQSEFGIHTEGSVAVTITGNTITAKNGGISLFFDATGSISTNTVTNALLGIDAVGNGLTIKSNKIFNSQFGVVIEGETAESTDVVESNTIINASVAGIDFTCVPDSSVHSNIITDSPTGVNEVPTETVTPNTYFAVAKLRNGC